MSPTPLQPPVSRRVMNLAHFLRQAARRAPDAPAVIRGGQATRWADFDARVDALVAALAARGLGKGDRVLVQARNSQAMFETMFAAFRLGAVWVPTNYRLLAKDIAYIAGASGARALILDHVFPETLAAVRAGVPELALSIAIGGPLEDCADYEDLLARHAGTQVDEAAVDYDDPCWFFFTSGTTGHPKAAVLTHGQMAFVVTNHLADLMPGLAPGDASLVVAPLSHGAGIHQLVQVARGGTTVLTGGDSLDPEEVFALIERHAVRNMFTVPSIVKRLVEHPAAGRYDLASLRHVIYAGAPMYRADQVKALRVLGKRIVQYFGLGEVTGCITVLPADLHDADDRVQVRLDTCGHARTGMQIGIFDEDGIPQPAGSPGEICVIGPGVFAGYFDNPEANARAFRDGWFRTGDLGFLDEAGFLTITGRASDMYISGGSNIYPREIEEVLLHHPAIRDAAVLGLPHPDWGEIGVAAVVLEAGASLDLPALAGWMEGRLARYKQPRELELFDDLPKSGYGKVTKKLVREAILARRQGA